MQDSRDILCVSLVVTWIYLVHSVIGVIYWTSMHILSTHGRPPRLLGVALHATLTISVTLGVYFATKIGIFYFSEDTWLSPFGVDGMVTGPRPVNPRRVYGLGIATIFLIFHPRKLIGRLMLQYLSEIRDPADRWIFLITMHACLVLLITLAPCANAIIRY